MSDKIQHYDNCEHTGSAVVGLCTPCELNKLLFELLDVMREVKRLLEDKKGK